MAFLKKSEAFRVPSLSEVSPEYAELSDRLRGLSVELARLEAEKRALTAAIDADPSPEVPSRVAELLGDPPDSKAGRRQRLAEIRREHSAIEQAIPIVRQRLAEAKGRASLLVTDRSRDEYGKRVRAVAVAVSALLEARKHYDAMIDEFERDEVAWTRLVPLRLNFLGDTHDGHAVRWLREARSAGYVE